MLLREVGLPPRGEGFPFDLPFLGTVRALGLSSPVTILVGENGSGKSTLLEAVALASELPLVGSAQSGRLDPTLAAVTPLADALRLVWSHRTRRGLFMRAQDYFGFVNEQNRQKAQLTESLASLRRESGHLPEAELRRISAPYSGSLQALENRYGSDLDALSHGESFLALFKGRITGKGVYLLDEPEAALSPSRQLALISLLKDAVGRGAQFLLATHAPILMAFPGADLLELRDGDIIRTEFDELGHVQLLRDFLAAPEAYLRHL